MPADAVPFLHAAHEVRETFAALQWASWLVIGLGVGAVPLTWGRIVAWIRAPEARSPHLRRWGIADGEMYFEVEASGLESWAATGAEGECEPLERGEDGVLRAPAAGWQPVSVISSDGVRLPL